MHMSVYIIHNGNPLKAQQRRGVKLGRVTSSGASWVIASMVMGPGRSLTTNVLAGVLKDEEVSTQYLPYAEHSHRLCAEVQELAAETAQRRACGRGRS